jgi:hypothetical protein
VQKVTLKAYLPKEIKPEEIVDKQDLEMAYDTQQGSYFVYQEYELKPGETIEKQVELKDIWNIPGKEIDSMRSEVNKLEALLKNTESAERVAFLKDSIEGRLDQINESQKNVPSNPERHISEYRDNLKILESVKQDMTLARSLLSQAKLLPTAVVWRLILAIIIFLGVLGTAFYFIWHGQLKSINESMPEQKAEPFTQRQQPQRHQAQEEEKSAGGDDIEKILGEEKPKEKE